MQIGDVVKSYNGKIGRLIYVLEEDLYVIRYIDETEDVLHIKDLERV